MVIYGSREMEESELEEGEACSYNGGNNNNNDNNTCRDDCDPDVALAYIGDKLQDVLGHLQKDFEGGVSAENLGTKFGGYGSFLPDHQRSPVWSQSRSPPKRNYAVQKSPSNFQMEVGHHKPSVSHRSVRNGSATSGTTFQPVVKTSSVSDSVKHEVCMSSTNRADGFAPTHETSKKSAKLADQRGLKVRIRMGPDNLSTQKNAAVYSGLGLDVSPPSSLGDSHSESERMSGEIRNGVQESPTSILRVMTSFPLHDELILSPLPEDILNLTAKLKPRKDGRPTPLSQGSQGLVKRERKTGGEKNMKPLQKNDFSGESNNGKDKESVPGVVSKKEVDNDTTAYEELVNTLKLPLLSDSNICDTSKGVQEVSNASRALHRAGGRYKVHHTAKQEVLESEAAQGDGGSEKPKPISSGNAWEDKESSIENGAVYPSKDSRHKGGKANKSVKAYSYNGDKRKELEPIDQVRQKGMQKVASQVHDGITHSEKETSSSGSKNKSRGSQTHGDLAAEPPKRVSKVGSSSVPRSKGTSLDGYKSRSESEDLKLGKASGNSTDRYREFFGDINSEDEDEEEENKVDSLEVPSVNRQKNSEVAGKSADVTNSAPEERMRTKNRDKPMLAGAQFREASNFASHSANVTSLESLPAPVAPVIIEDNWVLCDKCHQWRLLPIGRNTESLPDKWMCTMLDWLPGMNKCTISEEETTKALYDLYQVPLPERQSNVNGNAGQGVAASNMYPSSYNLQSSSVPEPSAGKKKHKLKEVLDATNRDDCAQFSNSPKKHVMKSSVRGRHSNDVSKSPLVSVHGFQRVSKSSDSTAEKRQHKQKQILKSIDHLSDGGETKRLKTKSKREHNQDNPRVPKKIKIEGKDPVKYNDSTISKDGDYSVEAQVSRRKSENYQVSANDRSPSVGNRDSKDGLVLKRKLKDGEDTQNYSVSRPGMTHNLQNSTPVDDLSEKECRKEKKPRVAISEGIESSASKRNGGREKRGTQAKNQKSRREKRSSSSQRSLNGFDVTEKEMGTMQPSVAATSSSLMVSGSHKYRASFQEVKGSPVESVSSSPMRIQTHDKVLLTMNRMDKDESQGNGYHFAGSPRKYPDVEEGGSGAFRNARTEKHFTAVHHGSVESPVLDCQERNIELPSSSGAMLQALHSTDKNSQHYTNEAADKLSQDSDRGHGGERQNDYRRHPNSSSTSKSSKLQSMDKILSVKSEVDNNGTELQEKFENRLHEAGNKNASKKEYLRKSSHENSKGSTKSISGVHDGRYVKKDALHMDDRLSTPSKSLLQNSEGERSRKRPSLEKTDQEESVSGGRQSLSLPPAGVDQEETLPSGQDSIVGSQKGIQEKQAAGASKREVAPRVPKKIGKAETPDENKIKGVDAPSPLRRDSSSHAATKALKEATDLKHCADKIKNSGANKESTGLYFEAALKFLSAASLLESSCSENARNSDMINSMRVYSSTAKLCEFCAHEYERAKHMASASLAYKCMEIAYMRVVYSSHISVGRDRQELVTALQMVAPGESPSSSASDVDNVNNQTSVDKATLSKGVTSPQAVGNNIVAGPKRPNFVRLLNFAQDVHFAMEASRKSRNAFAAANVILSEGKPTEGISSIKRALDFNFQDVEGFLRLVRLAKQAISHEECKCS